MPLRESNNNFSKKLPIVKNRRSQFCGLRFVQENYFEALIADHAFAGLWLSKTLIAAVGKCFRYSKFLGNICSVKQLFYRNKLIGCPLISQTIMLSLVHVLFTDQKPLSILIILRLSCSHFYQSVLKHPAPFVQKVDDPTHKVLRTLSCILWIVQYYYWFFISTVHWMVIYPTD